MSKSGTVYKLCCVDTDIEECYIGSTKNFTRRRTAHKSNCNNDKHNSYNLYVYQFIRDNGGFNNWSMIQLESVNYETKRDLEAHERRWIEQLKPKLNKRLPVRTPQEYYEDNKDKIKEYYEDNKDKKKEYYEDNKDKIKEYQKQYQKDNKDKIKQYKKQYQKEYQKNNKDTIKQYHKEYYKNNKDNKDNAV
tara:strand:+ start:173 stop:745 length:573 start_codon:yes stop_codon:yes gene_type:complete